MTQKTNAASRRNHSKSGRGEVASAKVEMSPQPTQTLFFGIMFAGAKEEKIQELKLCFQVRPIIDSGNCNWPQTSRCGYARHCS